MGDEKGGTALDRGRFSGFQRNEMVWHVGVVLEQFALGIGVVVVVVVELSLVACFCFDTVFSPPIFLL